LSKKEIFEFKVEVGDIFGMQVFEGLNKLMEACSNEFLISEGIIEDEVKEVSIRSVLHEDDCEMGDVNLEEIVRNVLNDILVVEGGMDSFLFNKGAVGSLILLECFDDILLIVGWGIGKYNIEFARANHTIDEKLGLLG